MSRIFEALRQSEMERKALRQSDPQPDTPAADLKPMAASRAATAPVPDWHAGPEPVLVPQDPKRSVEVPHLISVPAAIPTVPVDAPSAVPLKSPAPKADAASPAPAPTPESVKDSAKPVPAASPEPLMDMARPAPAVKSAPLDAKAVPPAAAPLATPAAAAAKPAPTTENRHSPMAWVAVEEPPLSRYLEEIPVTEMPSAAERMVSMIDERGLGAEKFRVLAARLMNLRHNVKLRSLQITSSVMAEGKSLISANLSFTFAKRLSSNVLLIEGDLRKPALCPLFGLGRLPGIGEWWKDESVPLRKFIFRFGSSSLYLLPAGHVQHPASILQSGRMVEALKEFNKEFNWVVIDTPPLLPMADSNLWARLADGTLLVVRKGTVTRKALRQALETMDSPKLVGVVMNDVTDIDQEGYYGKYYTGQPDGKSAKELRKEKKGKK